MSDFLLPMLQLGIEIDYRSNTVIGNFLKDAMPLQDGVRPPHIPFSLLYVSLDDMWGKLVEWFPVAFYTIWNSELSFT